MHRGIEAPTDPSIEALEALRRLGDTGRSQLADRRGGGAGVGAGGGAGAKPGCGTGREAPINHHNERALPAVGPGAARFTGGVEAQ